MTGASTYQRRVPRLLRLPLLYLLLQIGVSAVALDRSGTLEPVIRPDTRSYQRASRAGSLEASLQQHRTMGYPLFLRAMRSLTERPHLAPLPEVHAALFFGAVALLWFAIRAWTGSGWLALAAATPLSSTPLFLVLPRIQPDFVAAAAALAVLSVLLYLVKRPGSWPLWALLTLLVALTYQLRPAYLFLVPFVPFAGWVLRWCWEGRPRLAHLRWAAGLGLATVLPLLAFAGLRKSVVGDFGLVSFTGCNLIGITASFLDAEMIEALPPDTRELAGQIVGQRAAWGWQPMTLDSDTRIFQQQWGTNTWRVSINPARRIEERRARQARNRGERRRFRDIEVNATLMTLSREAIRHRPLLYLKWLRDTWLAGVGRLVRFPWVLWPLVALAVTIAIAWFRGRVANALDLKVLGLIFLCGAYTATKLMLVVAVAHVHERYMVAVCLLLPTALCVLLFSLWRGFPSIVDHHE